MAEKPRLGFFWGGSCGGCEITLVNIHEKILDVAANFDLVFCPCLMDTKKKDVEAWPDGHMAICFFNGAIRNSENEEMAHLLRKKAKVLIAFGSCACGGGIPALSNLHSKKAHIDAIYKDNPSIDNPKSILPQERTGVSEGELTLPTFLKTVKTLSQVVDIDYAFPGCPPESHQLAGIIDHLIAGKPLPPKGSILGGGKKTVCDECKKKKEEKVIPQFYRNYEIIPDPDKCLLEQGLLCMGVATRDGCGGLCPTANMPCIGCYGPPDGVWDQGAKMASTLGGMLEINDLKELSEEKILERIDEKLRGLPDFAGTAYKFHLADSLLKRAKASV